MNLAIGEVLKPQGIKGELKVRPYVDDVNRFKNLRLVLIDDVNYKVSHVRICPDAVYITLSGVSDRNTAESFRGKFLYVERENAIKLKKGSYFIVDVLGCAVVNEQGEQIGVVEDVSKSNVDIYTLKVQDGGKIRFPFLKDAVISVDTESKIITVDKKRFSEISVEDKL